MALARGDQAIVANLESTQRPEDSPPGVLRRVGQVLLSPEAWSVLWRVAGLGFILILLIFAATLVYKSAPKTGFQDVEFTRGLITILLLISVIAAMLLMILSALFGSDENTPARVTLSREVLTPMVGILGTIVGFYFGSQQTRLQPANAATPPGVTQGLVDQAGITRTDAPGENGGKAQGPERKPQATSKPGEERKPAQGP
jgi:hypothetical protein